MDHVMLALRLLLIATFTFLLSACVDEYATPGTAEEYQRQLESTLQELRVNQKELSEVKTELAVCLANIKDGRQMEERAKQLVIREAALDRREKQVIENEKRAEQQLNSLKTKEEEFYHTTKYTLAEIGEAMQIKKEYENMRADKLSAETSRDAYLSGIFGLIIALMVFIGFLVHYRTKNRQLEANVMLMTSKKPPEQIDN